MNNTNKNVFKWAIPLAIALFIVIFFIISQRPIEVDPIKIGVITPLSGDAAIYGESLKKGIDLALEETNKTGVLNRKIELIYEDTHLDSKTAISAFNKFINIDKVDFVIAAEGSGATSAVVPLSDKTKTLTMIPIASADSLKEAGDYVFRVIPADGYRGEKMGIYAKNLNFNRAAILYVNDEYGAGIKDIFSASFKKEGGEIVIEEAFSSGSTDYHSQLTKIKETNPDVIIIAARKEFPLILKQKNDLGLKAVVIASDVLDSSILEMAGNNMDGVLALDFAPTTDFVNFKINFNIKYGVEAPLYADYGYDSLKVIVEAIKESKSTDSTKIKDTLYDIKYKGATGLIEFDSLGEAIKKTLIPLVVKDGKFVEVK
jgi:branched-chain amino acid transport system substrate-binding protein